MRKYCTFRPPLCDKIVLDRNFVTKARRKMILSSRYMVFMGEESDGVICLVIRALT